MRPGSATSPSTRTTSPASSSAGTASGTCRRRVSCRSSTRSTTRSPAMIPPQGPATIVHGDYRLDNTIVSARRRRAGRARLGDLHARRPARRRRAAGGLLDRPRRRARARGPDGRRRRPGSGTATASRRATPRCPAATSPASTSTSRSGTGSWRACWRACTPATSAARSATATLPSCRCSRTRSTPPRRRWPRRRLRGDVMNDHQFVAEVPALEDPVLVVMMTGWIDASGAAAAAMVTLDKETSATPLVVVRRRHVHRLPRPAPDDGAARRRQHPAHLGDARAEGRPRRSTVATCCCSAVRSPTWPGTASRPRSPTSPSS